MRDPVAELDLMAATCSRLSLAAPGTGSLQTHLLEPLCTALGAEAAAFRQWTLAGATPHLAAIGSIGIAAAVTDAYLETFHRFDPALACLGDPSRFTEFPDPGATQTRAAFQHYVHDFLEPNGLHQHMGFMLRGAAGRQVWVFNFHRNRKNTAFDALAHARVRLFRSALQGQAELLAAATTGADVVLLSDRELAVARAVGQGLSNKQIAAELRISVRTVENHLRVIYRKLHIHSRTQLGILLSTH